MRTADEFVVAQFLARVFIASNIRLAVVVIAPFIIALCLPETASRELEEISPECEPTA